ncbi:MAG: hypothetical protein HQ567_26625 [Candidatus Nealsonbacteria bacterium]|nr:hypothetical protein [Candidatus Nealsonbacteria bacterium]
MASNEQPNPFRVRSPEKLGAEDAVHLFVNVFTDFYKIKDPGHSFLNGPRGSGKSMMFRYLQPDCQCVATSRELHKIDYFSVYVPLKNTSLNISELERIDDRHGSTYINEHLMSLFFAVEAIAAVTKAIPLASAERLGAPEDRRAFLHGFNRLLLLMGVTEELPLDGDPETHSWVGSVRDMCDKFYGQALQYVRRLAFSRDLLAYEGPLLGYMDFLFPLLRLIRSLSFLPDGPIFLLIDDADKLSLTQTKVLNSWVSSRTSDEASIKVSTQMQYKTLRTTASTKVDSTHDFSEVNISDIYTSSKSKYLNRVREIVQKRLRKYGVCNSNGDTPSAEEFFPGYAKQEEEIEKIKEELRSNFETEGRGFRASDDVVRYARPIYMTRLAGQRKASSKYLYAGFEQLAHISSGIVRYFLEPAAHMFSTVQAEAPDAIITEIPPTVQDEMVFSDSNNFRFGELEKIRDDEETPPEELEVIEKLGNLIEVLGGVFRQCLLTESRAERRVFSIALYDEPDSELRDILRLGVRCGYFHRSTIGKKDGTGRTRLYILSRRLAPTFKLDPNGFVGYLWLSSSKLKEAIHRPNTLLNRVRKRGVDDLSNVDQLTLFD